jgi:hypothetical protein
MEGDRTAIHEVSPKISIYLLNFSIINPLSNNSPPATVKKISPWASNRKK